MKELNKTMYLRANPETLETARLLRKNMTKPEKLLWEKLKGKQICGLRFRRQHPIDFFIVDFYCHEVRLVVEIDGEIHNQQEEYDDGRTAEMEKYDIKVIRFKNYEIENEIGKVVSNIENQVIKLLQSPPPGDLGVDLKRDLGVKKLRKELPLLLLFTIFIAFPSCHRNRLKTSEKTLTEEILLQEQENEGNDRSAREKQLAEGSGNSNGGIRYKEDRSVDPASPPVVIDIAGSLQNIRDIKLSDIVSEITYVRIQPPPDSSFRRDIKFTYHLTDDYIIASNLFGIIHYDREGRYINTVVKNQFTGIEIEPDKIIGYSEFTFTGSYNIRVKSSGNTLFYNYFNNISGQEYLMKYDCSANQIGQTIKYDPEDPSKIIGQGEPVVDLNHGRSDSGPRQFKSGGMWSTSSPNPGFLSQSFDIAWIDENHYSKKLEDNDMLGIFNSQGDTLATFKQHEKLVNYTKSLQRGTDGGSHYEHNGNTYFRNSFNDTIFQVIPPNRLKPVFVLNLGTYKVTRQQGVDPGFNLTGKIIPWEMVETEKYIFLTFTKDGYDCPNSRKDKTVKIYYALFSKKDHLLTVIKGDPFNYSPDILENNLDGGVPVWLSTDMIGKNGEISVSLKGKDLKERVRTEFFKRSPAPEAKKEELKKLAGLVSDNEDILMIIK